MKKVTIYSDGACEGNPGPGGWAAILLWRGLSRKLSGGEPATTNNRMELMAAIAGLNALKEPCEIEFFTDSQYLRKGVTEWLPSWKGRGWKTRNREPVKNEDLWRQLDEARQRHCITWRWVKGHAGDRYNEECDTLARKAVAAIRKAYPPEEIRARVKALKEALKATPEEASLF